MAIPTEVSLMDMLFDRDDPVLKFIDDKEMFKTEPDIIADKLENWNNEDDLLTDILNNDLDILGEELELEASHDDSNNAWHMDDLTNIKNEPLDSSDRYSDSGYSNGHTSPGDGQDYGYSPGRADDEEDRMSSTISTTSDHDEDSPVVVAVEPPRKKPRQVVKVSPMLSANPRSVLLPVNTANGVRTFKIVTPAGGIKAIKPITNNTQLLIKSARPQVHVHPFPQGARSNRGNNLKRARSRNLKPMSVNDSDEEITVISEDEEDRMYEKQQYPRLLLSPEERKLMQKEGVTLPTHYPLTKFEERELKRIRRKIRNKISAQDSRKRKKEYLDGLEDRVRQCTQENLSLVKKIKYLQTHNQSLVAQLKKLQTALAGKSTKAAQPATCLLVLILSVALVMAPNLRLSQPSESEIAEQDAALSENTPIAGRTRSLLSSEVAIEEELLSLGGEQEIPAELHELLRFHNMDSTSSSSGGSSSSGDSRKSSLSWGEAPHFLADHDYGPSPAKRSFYDRDDRELKELVAPHVDDVWPPPKIDHVLETVDKTRQFHIPEVDEVWLPKSSRLVEKLDTHTTEVKVNVSDGSGTRTVVIQVPKENK